jgi:protoporphyrinogen IX oxidase
MDLNTVKALHIIFVVSWFAGLFYMVRLFIYHTEAQQKTPQEAKTLGDQFKIMEHKLWYIITTPAMILTVVFGVWMLILYPPYLKSGWMQIKLGFVAVLLIYHFICQRIMNQMKQDRFTWGSTQLRLWNELATLLLVAIVFLAVLKNALDWIKGTVGFFVVGILLMMAVQWYKRLRAKKQ